MKAKKFVIFKSGKDWAVTTIENYNNRLQNTRLVSIYKDFESAEAVIDYLCKYSTAEKSDFKIINKEQKK